MNDMTIDQIASTLRSMMYHLTELMGTLPDDQYVTVRRDDLLSAWKKLDGTDNSEWANRIRDAVCNGGETT